MKRNLMSLVATMAVGLMVTGAWAGCEEKCKKSGKTMTVTVSDDGRSETAKSTKTTPCSKSAKTPCNKSSVTTVSDTAPCSKPCNKPCGKSKATTVADKTPCSKSAKTVSDKAPCGSKSAKLTSGKAPCGKSKGAPCGSHAALTSSKGGCKVTEKVNAVLASMPSMKFKIGSETTSCCQSAAALAKKHNKPIEYVVGDEAFKTEGEATVRLASLVEKQVEDMKVVHYVAGGTDYHCPKTAAAKAKKAHAKLVYRVGGVDFSDQAKAEKAAVLASEKLGEVKMSYKVGKNTFCCDKMAGVKAKETGTKMVYVVGEEETNCQYEAKMLMAKAKLAAIVAAATAVITS